MASGTNQTSWAIFHPADVMTPSPAGGSCLPLCPHVPALQDTHSPAHERAGNSRARLLPYVCSGCWECLSFLVTCRAIPPSGGLSTGYMCGSLLPQYPTLLCPFRAEWLRVRCPMVPPQPQRDLHPLPRPRSHQEHGGYTPGKSGWDPVLPVSHWEPQTSYLSLSILFLICQMG